MTTIELNCDMGEGCPTDAEVMPFIDSANVSCGAHAGTKEQIINTLKLAQQHDVKVGAHPGYADPENFGRHSLQLPEAELLDSLVSQLRFFKSLCDELVIPIHYVKPHGALNHDIIADESILKTLCQATRQVFNDDIAIMIPTGADVGRVESILAEYQLGLILEVFADRAYENDGLLRKRGLEGAVFDNPATIENQYRQIAKKRQITSYDNSTVLNIATAESVCIHGDNPASVQAVKNLRLT